jgi:hypothetical protein
VLQRLRSKNVTYNCYSEIIYDNCNVDFIGVLDRRRSITTYVSKQCCGRHVGGEVAPEEIQTHESHTREIMKLVLLENLKWCLTSLGLQHR